MKKQKTLFSSILFLLCLFISVNSYAADETWIHEYFVPDNSVVFNDVISVSGGGYLAVGKVLDSNTSDETHKNAFICRFDQNRQILWSKNFTFPGGSWEDDLRSVVESSDGGFIATGKTLLESPDGWGNPSFTSAVLILKVDGNGNLLWNKLLKNYGNSATSGERIKATVDGHYVIVGQKIVYQYHEQHNSYTSVTGGALITKIDTNGEVIFNHTYYGDWTHSWSWMFYDVVQDSEGSYYAVGAASTEAYSEGIGWGGILLVKIGSNGGLLWAKKLDYSVDGVAAGHNDTGYRILLSDNTLYVTSAVYPAFALTSLTLFGTRNWTKQYFPQRTYDAWVSITHDFIHSGDGNFFILTGGGAKSIVKVDHQGEVLRSKQMASNFLYNSLIREADNGLVVGGWYSHYAVGSRAVMSKYDSTGITCQDNYDLPYTVAQSEMLNNAVSHNLYLPPVYDEEIPVFSGPTLSVQENCSGPDCDIPGKVSLTSPSGTIEDTTPTFIWNEDSCATWYKIYLTNPSTGYKFVQWYEIEDNYSNYPEVSCSGGVCTITPGSALETGNYEWWIIGWNENGYGDWSDQMSFAVQGNDSPPLKITLISPSGAADNFPTFTWNKDVNATWYQIYISNTANTYKFVQWYEIEDNYLNYPEASCTEGDCSITLDSALEDGNYNWWVKGWNNNGNGEWSDGTSFFIDQ